jgi:uncharacterized SAM-binding protein YcdF (DUF218 family)
MAAPDAAAMKKLFFYALVCCICAGLLLYYHVSLLTSYAEFFTVHTATRGADAIVVLSGGIETRLPRAITLYKDGYAPRILMTQERPVNALAAQLPCSNTDKAQALLRMLHADCELTIVPSQKGGATSTFDEAYDLKDWARKNSYKRIIIATDDFHTRRAAYAFTKVFKGTHIDVEAAGAPNDVFSEHNWWKSDLGLAAYILEGVKYSLYLATSQNVPIIKNF